jgi:hypothetical protein
MVESVTISNRLLAVVPLSLPLYLCFRLLKNPLHIIIARWVEQISAGDDEEQQQLSSSSNGGGLDRKDALQSQLLAYLIMAMLGFLATSRMVPNIQEYTLRKGIAGKDLGKRGTATADKPMCVRACVL